ncbi:MAG: hypothetical protein H6706_19850 [Myxococcales bacterium]|nr:hypothetical protein [Myxococcales bacterium]
MKFNEPVAVTHALDVRSGEVLACWLGVALTYGGDVLRPDMAHHALPDDCTQEEGGAFRWRLSQCFRKDDGSPAPVEPGLRVGGGLPGVRPRP